MSDRSPEQILELLIVAAGTADVVRLAAVVPDSAAAGAETFTRAVLTDRWSQRWPYHLTLPGIRRPAQRVSRSLPNLIAVGAISGHQGPDLRVLDAGMLKFLADRAYMAEALDRQHPTSNTLPVGQATRAAAAALVSGGPVEAPVP